MSQELLRLDPRDGIITGDVWAILRVNVHSLDDATGTGDDVVLRFNVIILSMKRRSGHMA